MYCTDEEEEGEEEGDREVEEVGCHRGGGGGQRRIERGRKGVGPHRNVCGGKSCLLSLEGHLVS